MMEPQYKRGRSWWPGLKILDRYIIRKFVGTYLFAIAMIVVVVVVFDYVEKIDDFNTTQAPFKSIFLDYYLNFVPFFVNQFSALFTFIACIFFTSKLAHRTEIVAMLSGGMSFRRLMWPYFVGASIITTISLVLSLWVIPISQRTCVAFEEQYIPRRKMVQYQGWRANVFARKQIGVVIGVQIVDNRAYVVARAEQSYKALFVTALHVELIILARFKTSNDKFLTCTFTCKGELLGLTLGNPDLALSVRFVPSNECTVGIGRYPVHVNLAYVNNGQTHLVLRPQFRKFHVSSL